MECTSTFLFLFFWDIAQCLEAVGKWREDVLWLKQEILSHLIQNPTLKTKRENAAWGAVRGLQFMYNFKWYEQLP